MLVFPAASTTVQVTVVTPIGKVAGASLVTEAMVQLSDVIGDPIARVAKHWLASAAVVRSAGQVMAGASSSLTVTNCSQVVLFPAASTTVQVTVVTPIRKVAGASFETDATAQLSAVTGVPRATVAKQSPASVVAVMFEGQAMLGTSLSVMSTMKVHEEVLPDESVVLIVTSVSLITSVPGAGDCTITKIGSVLSVATTKPV